MSGKDITVVLQKRELLGKKVKHLRKDGLVPAVIHDHGKSSKVVMAPALELTKIFQQAGKHHPLELTLGKENYTALIKDVDFDPKKHLIRHVVFNAIKQDEEVETEVPVHLTGEIPAEKAGLLVIRQLDTVEIKALPKNLIDELTVDASGLVEIGDRVTVSQIIAPVGVEILTEAEHPIASIEETPAQVSEEAEEDAENEESDEGDVTAEGQEKSLDKQSDSSEDE